MKVLLRRHHRMVGETLWVFVGQGASALGTVLGVRVITELLPPDAFGALALALGIQGLAQGLAVGPILQAVLRYYPNRARAGREPDLRRAAVRALKRPVLVAFGVLGVSAAGWSIARPHQLWLAVGTLGMFLTEVGLSFEITFLNAARRQRPMAILLIARAWGSALAAVAALWLWGPHSAAAMAGYFVGTGAVLVATRIATRPVGGHSVSARFAQSDSLHLFHQLRTYALPLTALPLIVWVSGQADRYLIGALASLTDAGLYAALYGIASKPFLMLGASIELALRQPYYACVDAHDSHGAKRALLIWLSSVSVGALAICVAFISFHVEIVMLLLGADYRAHSGLMAWIATGYVLLSAAQLLERVCYAHQDTSGVLGVQAAGALLSVVISFPMVSRYGIEGAAWAVPIYFGAQFLITLARARHVSRGSRQKASRARPVVGTHPSP